MGEASNGGSAAWLDRFASRTSDLWRRSSQAGAELASAVGARSLEDGDWTVDTITSDLIEASERLTPLVGEAIDLWLELVQQAVAGGGRHGP